jgi:subtilisin family serine protease
MDGHGTGVASLIVGHGRVQGVAPDAKVLPIRVKVSDSDASSIATAGGIDWAVAHGAKVINISQASPIADPRERDAINRAIEQDIIVVAGAGNQPNMTTVQYPARYEGVVAACATNRDGGHSAVSVTGPELILCAPGERISSAFLGGRYFMSTGTSDSTALISGAVALVRAKFPSLPAKEVVHRLTATAIDKGIEGRDNIFGYGVVNPLAALTAEISPATASNHSPLSQPSLTTDPRSPTMTHSLLLIGIVVLMIGVLLAVIIRAIRG